MNPDVKTKQGPTVGGRRRSDRRASGAVLSFLLLNCVLVSACSGKIVTTTGDEDDSSGGSGGTASTGGTAGTGGSGMTTGGGPSTGGSEPYVDPECPDEEPPESYSECDPLGADEDCPAGYGCYPYLEYPFGKECGHAMFGSICLPAGTGERGDDCDNSGDCASGFICVLGTKPGKTCAPLCEPIRDHMCAPGLICGETDIQGYGVCS